MTERLEHWAAVAPTRTLCARRDRDGQWQHLTYADALLRVRRVAQAFIDRGLSPNRTVLILSGNSLEHAIVALAAMYAGVPYAPIAPAYSLMVREYTTLQALVTTMRPGLIFAADGAEFDAAIAAVATRDIEVVTATPPRTWHSTPLAHLEAANVTSAVDLAHAQVFADTIAKVLFTSGYDTPPSIDALEITDKGSLNQRAVLGHRASTVEALYAADPSSVLL